MYCGNKPVCINNILLEKNLIVNIIPFGPKISNKNKSIVL